MNIIANGTVHDSPQFVSAGGEGEIYKLGPLQAAKIYHPIERQDVRRKKVFALCNAFWRNIAGFGTNNFAFPQSPAYIGEVDYENLAGFTMPWFEGCVTLDEVQYNLKTKEYAQGKSILGLNDQSAIELIYQIFVLVEQLHKGRVILGDVNSKNILYDPARRCPVFVDLDSAQIALQPCTAISLETLDPRVEGQMKASGGRMYFTTKSDIYGLACVAFRFWVGVSPFKLVVDPVIEGVGVTPEVAAKRAGVTSIHYHVEGDVFLKDQCRSFVAHPINTLILERLSILQKREPVLFDFLYHTLAKGRRESLLYSLSIDDARHPSNIFFVDLGVKKWTDERDQKRRQAILESRPHSAVTAAKDLAGSGENQNLEDPIEFSMFLNSFDISVAKLCA